MSDAPAEVAMLLFLFRQEVQAEDVSSLQTRPAEPPSARLQTAAGSLCALPEATVQTGCMLPVLCIPHSFAPPASDMHVTLILRCLAACDSVTQACDIDASAHCPQAAAQAGADEADPAAQVRQRQH